MLTLIEQGGLPIWFLLIFGAFSLLLGAGFARRPEPARLKLVLAMSIATLCTTLTSVCAALAMVGHHLPEYLAQHPKEARGDALLQGMAESLGPAVLGFTLLTLVALFVALGCYRGAVES